MTLAFIIKPVSLNGSVQNINFSSYDSSSALSDDSFRQGVLWEPYMEWELAVSVYNGNPYDIIAKVIFTHERSGESIETGVRFHRAAPYPATMRAHGGGFYERLGEMRTGEFSITGHGMSGEYYGYWYNPDTGEESGNFQFPADPGQPIKFKVPGGGSEYDMVLHLKNR